MDYLPFDVLEEVSLEVTSLPTSNPKRQKIAVAAHPDFQRRLECIACNYHDWQRGTPMDRLTAIRSGKWAKLIHHLPIPTRYIGDVLTGYVFLQWRKPRTDKEFLAMCERAHNHLMRTEYGYAIGIDDELHTRIFGEARDSSYEDSTQNALNRVVDVSSGIVVDKEAFETKLMDILKAKKKGLGNG